MSNQSALRRAPTQRRQKLRKRVISPDVVQPAMLASSSKSVARRSNSDFQRDWKSTGGRALDRFVNLFSRLTRSVHAIELCKQAFSGAHRLASDDRWGVLLERGIQSVTNSIPCGGGNVPQRSA